MSRSFERVTTGVCDEALREILDNQPGWLLVNKDKGPSVILRTEDLAIYVE